MHVLEIPGLTPPTVKSAHSAETEVADVTKMELQRVAPGDALAFEAALPLPPGYKLNPQAAVVYRVTADGEQGLVPASELGVRDAADVEGETIRFRVPLAAKSGRATLQVAVNYTFCRDGASGLCKLGSLRWTVPVEVAADASETVVKLKD